LTRIAAGLKSDYQETASANLNPVSEFLFELLDLNIVLIRVYPRKSAANLLTP